MRTDVDFEAIDAVDFTDLTWGTTDQAVCSILDLALEAVQAHEVDQCVWSLKKAIEKSSDGVGINHAIVQLLMNTDLHPEAVDVYRKLIAETEVDEMTYCNFCECLFEIGEEKEAEEICLIRLRGALGSYFEASWYLYFLILICSRSGRDLASYFYSREYLRVRNRRGPGNLNRDDYIYWSLSMYSERFGDLDEAKKFAVLGKEETPDIDEDWDSRIEEITLIANQPKSTPEKVFRADIQNQVPFEQWFLKGSYWHDVIKADFFSNADDFLNELFLNGAIWADESTVLFDGFDVEEEALEESLARAEALSAHLHLVPLWPVYLETNEVSIAMTLNRNFLLAWVGKGLEGLLVGVNIKTWDLYHADDRDARFACGAVLNWFLDCSLNVSEHRMFDRTGSAISFVRPWETKFLTTWTTTKPFYEELESLRYDSNRKPPRAHRVRGHIRTLSERQPTDDARDNAPAYIRKNMGPADTFVRSYAKSGDLGTEKLLVHLKTNSNLGDFLGADAWDG